MKHQTASKGEPAWPACALATTRRAARLLTQLYDGHLAEHGIEAAQFALLMTIEASPDKGQMAIAVALGMDKTTLSRNLKVLRSRGWVLSQKGSDARSKSLALTQEGRALLVRARPAWKRAQSALRRQMGEGAWETTLSAVRGLSASALAASGAD